MRVFVSWSKEPSHRLALLLRDWLPEVIQAIEPWVSSEDIGKGNRWGAEIAKQLGETDQGIICVTANNASEPWLNFEAGALAKSVADAAVRPVLYGIRPRDLAGPLAEFQATEIEEEDDVWQLLDSLNQRLEPPLKSHVLKRAFEAAWPRLVAGLQELPEVDASPAPQQGTRSDEDVMGELLERVRRIDRLTGEADERKLRMVTAPGSFLRTPRRTVVFGGDLPTADQQLGWPETVMIDPDATGSIIRFVTPEQTDEDPEGNADVE